MGQRPEGNRGQVGGQEILRWRGRRGCLAIQRFLEGGGNVPSGEEPGESEPSPTADCLGCMFSGQEASLKRVAPSPKAGHFLGGTPGPVLEFQEGSGLLELLLKRLELAGNSLEVLERMTVFLEGLLFLLFPHRFEELKVGGELVHGRWGW